ncbi:MAG: hypothetical protein JWN40_170 [Phycisphaerales bacterium]|nr:hypothetical protein [Phycisphaerales bacterium]
MSQQEEPRRPLAAPLAIVALVIAAALTLPALAQNRPLGGNDNPGPGAGIARVGIGRVDPFASVKLQINASDEEWKVIGPKLRVLAAAQQIVEADPAETVQNTGTPRGGGGGGNGAFAGPAGAGGQRGGGGPGGPGGGGPGGGGGPPGERRQGGPDGPGGFQGRPNVAGGQGRPGGPGGGGGPGGPGGPGGNPFRSSPISLAQADLKTALDNPQTPPQEIQEKVAAVRHALQKAKADLAAARKDLVELLTADQQLVLVGLGYLE